MSIPAIASLDTCGAVSGILPEELKGTSTMNQISETDHRHLVLSSRGGRFAKPGETQAQAIKRLMRKSTRGHGHRFYPYKDEATSTLRYVQIYYANNTHILGFTTPDFYSHLSPNDTLWPEGPEVEAWEVNEEEVV